MYKYRQGLANEYAAGTLFLAIVDHGYTDLKRRS